MTQGPDVDVLEKTRAHETPMKPKKAADSEQSNAAKRGARAISEACAGSEDGRPKEQSCGFVRVEAECRLGNSKVVVVEILCVNSYIFKREYVITVRDS
jgi:hypothetical protein